MGALWNLSLVPHTDINGDPYAGAKAYFFDENTTTPRTTYTDGDNAIPHDHPVIANASGVFPAIFLQQGNYRLRILTANDVTLQDVDAITTPVISQAEEGGGDVDAELLKVTGEYGFFHAKGAISGYVRAGGRSIGSGTSGATERANVDCEDLFVFLWAQDSSLTVSGGRGASAAADWAANKTIGLPDARSRSLIGLAALGNTDVALIADVLVDNSEDADTLGATMGASDHALIEAENGPHEHSHTLSSDGAHDHNIGKRNFPSSISPGSDGTRLSEGSTSGGTDGTIDTSSEADHSHTLVINSSGDGDAHNNMQPSFAVGVYIKL